MQSLLPKSYQEDPILCPLLKLGLSNKDLPQHISLPRASILILLFPFVGRNKTEWHALFTQRPLSLKSHPGEVCFPGGKQDDADGGDDVVTALRETREEVGIAAEEVIPIARCTTGESVGGLCVVPVVAIWLKPILPSQLKINHDEVEAAFYVPVSYFWNEENCVDKRDLEWRGGIFTMRTYLFQDEMELKNGAKPREFKIWGLTAHVAHDIATICNPTKESLQFTSSESMQGKLYRWMDDTSGKPYWSQRYFVLVRKTASSGILHQYDSERQANTKKDTATKKNRLLLDSDCIVTKDDVENDKHVFRISTLDGRIEWKLAAVSEEIGDEWIDALQQATKDNSQKDAARSKLKAEARSNKKPKQDDT